MTDAQQTVRRHPIDRPFGCEGVDASQQLLKSDTHLEAGEAGTEADVGPEPERSYPWRTNEYGPG